MGVAHEINNPNGLILRNMPTLHDTLIDALALLAEHQPNAQVGGLSIGRTQELLPQLSEEMEDAGQQGRIQPISTWRNNENH